MTDDTTTARLDTADPDRPRGDVGLGDARREALAEALTGEHRVWLGDAYGEHPVEVVAPLADHLAAALAPLVAGWLGEERAGIAQAIEALPEHYGDGWPCHAYEIKADAAGIARGDA